MSRGSQTAYLTSALLVLTIVMYAGTLVWVVPMIVSLVWTVVLLVVHRRRGRAVRDPSSG